jgi:thioesterase domain-containing protein
LLATRLISRIRATLGVEIAIRTLFEAPTVEALQKHILGVGPTHSALEALLPLRTRGDRAPLFFIHPAVGLSWCYAALLPHIPTNYPIYGLQARTITQASGASQPAGVPGTIAGIAEEYLAQIRIVQPTGPYHLIGWSFGALVAHAIATRLQADREAIAVLALIDGYPAEATCGGNEVDAKASFAGLLTALDLPFAPVQGNASQTFGEVLAREGHPFAALETCHQAAIIQAYQHNVRLAQAFKPAMFYGDVMFLATTNETASPIDTWAPFVRGTIKSRRLDISHEHMLHSAHAAVIGAAVTAELDKVRSTPA